MTETVITMNGLTNRFEYRSRCPERVMAIVELVGVWEGIQRGEQRVIYIPTEFQSDIKC